MKRTITELRRVTKTLQTHSEKRDRLILEALDENVTVREIATAADITVGRVYQIRDRERNATQERQR